MTCKTKQINVKEIIIRRLKYINVVKFPRCSDSWMVPRWWQRPKAAKEAERQHNSAWEQAARVLPWVTSGCSMGGHTKK
ncbi:hypothetical protein Ddye_001244, partial [Dipteronia dyeriana]